MRNTKSLMTWLFVLALTGLLAACGSSPGSDPAAAVPTGPPAQGIAVDPYIVGAIFQEVAADGTLLQRQSTASDASGRFSFPQPLTPGSIIELKPASKGMHNGVICDWNQWINSRKLRIKAITYQSCNSIVPCY